MRDVAAIFTELARQRVIELFAGPGGYSEGLSMLGLKRQQAVGIEFEANACQTAEAAGHRRLKADVTALSPLEVACFYFPSTQGKITGFHASPPCQGFSMAGKGKGREDSELLLSALSLVAAGVHTAEQAIARVKEHAQDDKSHLSLEPLRWIVDLNPEWVTLEQVPAVLPLWEGYAEVLRAWGYSVATGNVQAEQYGVPQTRKRAILVASRVLEVQMPVPTHSKYYARTPDKLDAGLPKWVSMAEALGWGGHDLVGFPRKYDGRGEAVTLDGEEYRGRDLREGDLPAFVVTEKARSWDRFPQSATTNNSHPQQVRSIDAPAFTVTGSGRNVGWRFTGLEPKEVEYVNGTHEKAARRTADKPAPTVMFGARLNSVDWHLCPTNLRPNAAVRGMDQPAPTMAFGHETPRWVSPEELEEYRARLAAEVEPRVNNQSGTEFDLAWPADRPSPVVAGRDLVTMPGANANRFNGSTKSRNDGIRVTVEEAGVLQSFPADYPWKGTKTAKFQQVGNAVPPLLGARVALAALGCASVSVTLTNAQTITNPAATAA